MTIKHERIRSNFLEQMCDVLREGKTIAIFGWKASNHDRFTRKLRQGKVRFFDQSHKAVPETAGMVLFTRFGSHSQQEALRRQTAFPVRMLQVGEIRRLLWQCRDLLRTPRGTHDPEADIRALKPPPERQGGTMPSCPDSDRPATPAEPAAPVTPVQLSPAEQEEQKLRRFAARFLEIGGGGQLSKYQANDLVREIFGEDLHHRRLPKLIESGWLIAIRGAGQKAGHYTPGTKMLEKGTEPEPTDPIERARWLIAKEPALLERKHALTAELAKINFDLAQIEEARGLLGKLADLMRKS